MKRWMGRSGGGAALVLGWMFWGGAAVDAFAARLEPVLAVAVDRRGIRLGRGGGFYDRSLPMCTPGTRLVAVVRDCEILDEVPVDSHDVPMTHALTPGGGLIPLARPSPGRECRSPDGGSST